MNAGCRHTATPPNSTLSRKPDRVHAGEVVIAHVSNSFKRSRNHSLGNYSCAAGSTGREKDSCKPVNARYRSTDDTKTLSKAV